MSDVLVVFAKDPQPGAVKTRLTPPFTPAQAAELYAAMLDDVIDASREAAARVGAQLVVALDPASAVPHWQERLGPALPVAAQAGAGLSERMQGCFAAQRAAGAMRIVLRGSDSPTLPPALLVEAFAALHDADVVLGPDRAEGYNLVGARVAIDGLFDHAMSTASVLDDTLANAERLGLSTRLLAASADIDVATDLDRLREGSAGSNDGENPSFAWRTLATLTRLQRSPHPTDR